MMNMEQKFILKKKMEITIREKEIIAGNRTIKPRAGIISPEMDPYWILKEIDTIDTRPQDRFIFKESDKKIFLEESSRRPGIIAVATAKKAGRALITKCPR